MIKICYIIGQLTRHGAEKQLYELVKGIDRKRFQPTVISLSEDGYWTEHIRRLNIDVIEFPRKRNREVGRLVRLCKLVSELRPDVVHTYLIPGNFYGRIAAVLNRVPIIIASERNLPLVGKDKTLLILLIDKILSVFSDGIICNSCMASNILIEKYFFSRAKVMTVHNGIDKAELRDSNLDDRLLRKSGEHRIRTVGTVGRLWPQKNHFLFLDMARLLLTKSGVADLAFVIVGEGPMRNELETYAKNIGVADNVIFTGERFDIPGLLEGMDVFVMTSSYEGLSNTIMEAMLAGLPVVATDVGGNRELIADGETGFLCSASDCASLAEKVSFLLSDEEAAARMGAHGRTKIENEFGIEKMVRDTEKIYMNLLRQNKVILEDHGMKQVC